MAPVLRWLLLELGLAGGVAASTYLISPGEQAWERVQRDGPALERLLAELSSEGGDEPLGPWRLELPRDHGAHPESQAETWTIAAHLAGPEGEDLGVQISPLRMRIVPDWNVARLGLEPHAIYRAHMIMVDGQARSERGGPAKSEVA